MGKPLRITNGFDKLTDARLLERAYGIHQNVSTATSYFPTPVPTMANFLARIEEFQSAVNNAATGDKIKIVARDAEKEKLIDDLHLLSYYVLFASGGDILIARLSGYTLAKPGTPQGEMPAPKEVKLTLGDQSGVMNAKVKNVRGAVAYIHQYTTDPTLAEESWVKEVGSKSLFTFIGLTPGTTYYVRVGAVGRKGQVKFSNVVSKIAA